MVAVAAVLRPGTEALGLFGWELPVVCTLRATTGIPCPGCGLTRSIVATVHGDLSGAFASHRLGPPLLLWLLLQALRQGLWLALPTARVPIDRGGRWLDRAGLVFVPALAILWLARFL